VKQTFNFPQEGFDVQDNFLQFNGLDLQALIAKYGTPMKLTYLPKIGNQIKRAKQMFANAFKSIGMMANIIIAIVQRAVISHSYWRKR
jgi:arginine decarboxylase